MDIWTDWTPSLGEVLSNTIPVGCAGRSKKIWGQDRYSGPNLNGSFCQHRTFAEIEAMPAVRTFRTFAKATLTAASGPMRTFSGVT
jgi:hypothetical protein